MPVLLILGGSINLSSADFANIRASFVLSLAFGTLLIGFAEELMCRGLLVVGFRGSLRDPLVWLASRRSRWG